MRIPVQSIRLDGDTQSRDSVNQIIINEYADDMREGAVFPPVVVFDDGDDIWLSEGFHRLYAARQAARTEIEADVRKGTRRDAQRNSMQSNATHGARRTNADKRRAVEMAFRWLLEEGRSLEGITNVEVAKMAAVDEKTAARARGQIVESLNTIPEKSDEPRINGVSSSAEIERLQVELAAAEAKARGIESLQRRLDEAETRAKKNEALVREERANADRQARELTRALNEAQAKAKEVGVREVEVRVPVESPEALAQIAKLKQAIDAKDQEIATLGHAGKSVEKLTRERDQLRKEIDQAKRDNERSLTEARANAAFQDALRCSGVFSAAVEAIERLARDGVLYVEHMTSARQLLRNVAGTATHGMSVLDSCDAETRSGNVISLHEARGGRS